MKQIALIYLVTVFFSFGVQTGFYLYYRFVNDPIIKKYKTVFDYTSGVIGDGVLVPLVNVFGMLSMEYLHQGYGNYLVWVLSLIGGILITLIFHYGQQYYRLTNWSMPETGKWNTLGFYHSLFMFFESSLLCYMLFTHIMYSIQHGFDSLVYAPIRYAFLMLFFFFLTFTYDYWQSLFKKLVGRRVSGFVRYAYEKIPGNS